MDIRILINANYDSISNLLDDQPLEVPASLPNWSSNAFLMEL